MSDSRLERLRHDLFSGRVTRRQFMQRAAALGVGTSAMMTLGGSVVGQEASPESDEIITSSSFEGQTLVVTSYGGTWEEFMRSQILPPFEEATGAKVELAVGLSTDWMTKLRAAGVDKPPYDVVIANETYISSGRIEGHFDALPVDKIPNLEEVHESLRLQDDIGVFALVSPISLAYMHDEVTVEEPFSWLDLADYLPSLGIYNIKNSASAQHILMIAEALGGDYKDWEPGFEWIRDNLRDAKQTDFSGDMETLLSSGEVTAGLLDSPSAARLSQQGIGVSWAAGEEGLLMFEQNTNITTGSEVKDLAYSFVNYWLGVDVQTKFAEAYFWTPSNVKVEISDDLADLIPVTRDNMDQMKHWDYEWLNSGPREDMIKRWNREMTF